MRQMFRLGTLARGSGQNSPEMRKSVGRLRLRRELLTLLAQTFQSPGNVWAGTDIAIADPRLAPGVRQYDREQKPS